MQEKIHLKGLHGLRAIAAIGVVLSHISAFGFDFPLIINLGLAQYSVTIFFTLSGFLITFLLLKEKMISGINIRKFYIRRILRIWPLYFAYLIAAMISIVIYKPGGLHPSLVWYLFFAANIPAILKIHIPFIFHYWTLGTEEQFYLFWPWIIKRANHVLKVLIIFTFGFLLLKLFFRYIYFQWGNITPLFILSFIRFECMSLGGIAAILCLQGNKIFLQIVTHKITEIVCWMSILAMILNKFYITPLLDHDLAALVAIGLIVNQGFNKKPLLSLENRYFDFLGRISYGIYIIHPLVIFYFSLLISNLKMSPEIKSIVVYISVLSLTIVVAWLSYEFFAKRFLKLKNRFSIVKSLDSKYLS